MSEAWRGLKEGDTLRGTTRTLTPIRTDWYAVGIWTASTDQRQGVKANIHTDADYARTQGLPTAIGDGMTATNWVSEMLLDYFGEHYVMAHSLRTKFIKPTPVGTVVSVAGRVTGITEEQGRRVYRLEIWTQDASGVKLTVGDASVAVPDTTRG